MEIYIRLKDKSGSHNILHQQKALFGTKVEKVLKDSYVGKLLKDGVVEEVKESDYNAYQKLMEDKSTKAKSETTEVVKDKVEDTGATSGGVDAEFTDLADKFIDQGIITKDSKGYKLDNEYIGKKPADVAVSVSKLTEEKLAELKALLS